MLLLDYFCFSFYSEMHLFICVSFYLSISSFFNFLSFFVWIVVTIWGKDFWNDSEMYEVEPNQ